jgi:hypothetical protein
MTADAEFAAEWHAGENNGFPADDWAVVGLSSADFDSPASPAHVGVTIG